MTWVNVTKTRDCSGNGFTDIVVTMHRGLWPGWRPENAVDDDSDRSRPLPIRRVQATRVIEQEPVRESGDTLTQGFHLSITILGAQPSHWERLSESHI
jgi:hypothetical protein